MIGGEFFNAEWAHHGPVLHSEFPARHRGWCLSAVPSSGDTERDRQAEMMGAMEGGWGEALLC